MYARGLLEELARESGASFVPEFRYNGNLDSPDGFLVTGEAVATFEMKCYRVPRAAYDKQRPLVFALCDRCAAAHDVVFSPTEAGVEVRAKRRAPLVVGGVKLVPSAKRPCRPERGEIRRVPQDRANLLVGYHVCCPRYGFNTPALAGNDGLDTDEGEASDNLTFWMRCTAPSVACCCT